MGWLKDDIQEIFERGIASKDINIVKHVAYLPISLLEQAIDNRDHLIFQLFIHFPVVLYEGACEFSKVEKRKADIIFDRSWRHLKELFVYHLKPKLNQKDYSEQDFKDYYIEIIKAFQGLLKLSFDKRDIGNFKKFLSEVSSLFGTLE